MDARGGMVDLGSSFDPIDDSYNAPQASGSVNVTFKYKFDVESVKVTFDLNGFDGILAGASTELSLGDIDGDGTVSIADITALVDIVLGKTYTPNRVRRVDGNAELEYR